MFLFHWCMNAMRCRRDTTLETMPLSPTKYNGLPPALDCSLQRQLVDDIPEYSYDVTLLGRSLLDVEDPVEDRGFFQDHLNTVCPRVLDDGHDSAAALSSCHPESRDFDDVTAGGCLPEPMTSQPLGRPPTLCTEDFAANGIHEHDTCDCETAAAVHENAGNLTCGSDMSSTSAPSFTDLCMFSSQFRQPHFNLELQHGLKIPHKMNSLVIDDSLLSTQDVDKVDFPSRNPSHSTDDCTLDKSQRNAVASFPADTFQDPVVFAATFLVNSAVTAAVRILVDDVKLKSEPNPINQVDLLSDSNTSNSIQQLPFPCESTPASDDPVKAAAGRIVDQVLSEIAKQSSSSVSACAGTLAGETAITPTCCVAQSHHSSSPCCHCESDSKPAADNDAESGATGNADGVLMPDAAEDYLSDSSAIGCCPVAEPELLAAHELTYVPNSNYNSVYSLCDDSESTTSLSGGRLTFVSDGWRPVSPPFSDAYSSDCASGVLNNNNVVVGLFDDINGLCRCVGDELSQHDQPRYVVDDALARMMCSEPTAERDVDLSSSSDVDDSTKSSVNHGAPDDDNYPDIRESLEQFAAESTTAETWNSCEPSCRPEDYFFHRYVIPVDQLEAGETTSMTASELTNDTMTTQSDRDHQYRTKMQLDLNAKQHCSDIDADIEAVAAFCRAMFTPIDSDGDDIVDRTTPFDIVSNPETPDAEECSKRGVRRCISLRTSPGTPHKKKSVRFADALGLDLEYVRQIQSSVDEPHLTITSTDDDGCRPRRPLLAEASAVWHRPRTSVRRYLCACFQPPGTHPDFMERVRRSRVVLESCDADDRALTISGVVRVANVAYHKTVAARVTTDGWATQADVTAEYVPRSNDGTTDRFSFQIVLPPGATDVGRRVEFAVYFIALFDSGNRSETYWDNNFGTNYCFECYAHDDAGTTTLDTDRNNSDDNFSAWLCFV